MERESAKFNFDSIACVSKAKRFDEFNVDMVSHNSIEN